MKTAHETAAKNLAAEFPRHFHPFAQATGMTQSAATKFERLKKGKATLFILEFIKNNPGTTRRAVKNAYLAATQHCISENLFQNLRWAKLITPRKYSLTRLGNDLLTEYGIR